MTRMAAMTLLVVLAGSQVLVGGDKQRAQAAVEAERRALNDQVAQMQLRHDVTTASRLLADEYIFMVAAGTRITGTAAITLR